MKEIKFRAWDTRTEKWYASVNPPFSWELEGEWNGGKQPSFTNLEISEGVILMQYTGLKDKNGKMIFEGDIIKYFSKTISEIKYGEIKCILERFIVKVGSIHFPMSGLDEIYAVIDGEIIGNIYQNPELLTNKL